MVLETDENLRRDAFAKWADTPESVSFTDCFTDCVVMTVADRYDTKQIFGFDLAFRRSGYLIPDAATTSRGG
jgi:predicted nucleic acid-binding protein